MVANTQEVVMEAGVLLLSRSHGALPPIHILEVVITLPRTPLSPLTVRTGASETGSEVMGELVRSMVGT